MEKIFKILNDDFIINRIIINNFTVLDEDLTVEIDITSKLFGRKKLLFSEITKLDIDSNYYGCSEISSILIEDISELQWERVFYKILISEDTMTFYCRTIDCY